ncbi:hypothetical protein C8F04DRAFT_1272203 [Mycena alexandri]|uniref:Uncharacterized protein n=1 Tax=Mycena alexandri TaxID=1745969 RepID=A0AAD6SC40_9AGAR|nr:hypothetical protein C8F04DRAFT_1272203 [Mycena alexandri]
MLDNAQLAKHFKPLLKALEARIKALPESLPVAVEDSQLHYYLVDFEIPLETDVKDLARRQWEHTFSCMDDTRKGLFGRGEYGTDLICPFLEFFAEQEAFQGDDATGMLARWIRDLNTLMDSIPDLMSSKTGPAPVPTSQFFKLKPKVAAFTVPVKRPSAHESEDDLNDKNYHPPQNPAPLSEEETNSDAPQHIIPAGNKGKGKTSPPNVLKNKPKPAQKDKEKKSEKPPAKRQTIIPQQQDSEDESEPANEDDTPIIKSGRSAKQGKWVITNYVSPPTVSKSKVGNPLWSADGADDMLKNPAPVVLRHAPRAA